MKQNSQSEALTKSDFLAIMTAFRREFKEEIRSEIKKEITALEIRIDIKLEKMELRIYDYIREENSKTLTRFDSWAKELETARDDRTISTRKLTKHAVTLSDHGRRIKKLEKKVLN